MRRGSCCLSRGCRGTPPLTYFLVIASELLFMSGGANWGAGPASYSVELLNQEFAFLINFRTIIF